MDIKPIVVKYKKWKMYIEKFNEGFTEIVRCRKSEMRGEDLIENVCGRVACSRRVHDGSLEFLG